MIDDSEQLTDEMLEQGRKIMREAIEQYKPVAIYAGFSGGNDSIVTTHFACEEFGATALSVNTLIGIEKTRVHYRETAQRYGWEHIELRAEAEGMPDKHRDGTPFDPSTLPAGKWTDGNTAYEEWVLNFGFAGPGQHPRMYQRLKERSFNRAKREAKQGRKRTDCVMFVTGIRHDESAIRAGYQRAVQKQDSSIWVNPFYFTTAAHFEAYRQEFGLPRNPVSQVVGISGECLCGAFASPDEIELVRKVDQQIVAYIEGLQDRCTSLGLPNRWGCKPTGDYTDARRGQLRLWGDEPTFQPACVGCIRRSAMFHTTG